MITGITKLTKPETKYAQWTQANRDLQRAIRDQGRD
jgi:hypothetical protein